MTMAAIGAAGANILGGILGGSAASEEAKKAQALLDSAIARINGLQIPDITKEIIYQQFMTVGDFTPQALNKTIEENAPLALIRENPENKLKQEKVYAQVEQATRTGLSPEDKLAMEQARRKTSQDVLAQMASARSGAQQRGIAGGGQELASQLAAIQGGADRQSMENMQAAANASQNRQAQLQNLYNMASGMRQTDLGVEQSNVQARNLRDEMMMKYATNREMQNKAWQEEANRARRQQEQATSNANIQRSQAEALRRGHEAPMAMFDRQMSKEGAIANLMGNKANVGMGLGSAKAKMWSDIGSGVGKGFMAYGMANMPKTTNIGADNISKNLWTGADPSGLGSDLGIDVSPQDINALKFNPTELA